MMLALYKSKADLKAAVGQPLKYRETSAFGPEFVRTGTFAVARRPHLQGGGREWFASVTMSAGLIAKVS